MGTKHDIPVVGRVFTMREHGDVRVVEYNSSVDVKVQFSDGTIFKTSTVELRRGTVWNRNVPSVEGVGYIGIGPHRSKSKGTYSKDYMRWSGMLHRCYGEKELARRPSYSDCSVDEDWHNFQNFAEWLCVQPNYGKDGFHLDKDMTVLGNKVYGPRTCSLVPADINAFFTGVDSKSKRDCPTGVYWDTTHNCFIASCNIDGLQKLLGRSQDKNAAFLLYKTAKEGQAKVLSDRFKGVISSTVYNNLINYEVQQEI